MANDESNMDPMAEQSWDLPIVPTVETCSGRTYIVTGANIGLGLETAKHLVRLGAAKVIMAVRNLEAGETAKTEIESATKTHDVAEVWSLDLASYDSVKAFAKKAIEKLDRIDALIENAGIALDHWTMAEGDETTIKVNVLSTFLLGVLLFPKMRETAAKFHSLPHLVIVSSSVGFTARGEFDKVKDDPLVKMNEESLADMKQRYIHFSKLVEIFAVRNLAPLIPTSRTGVVVNLLTPGLCETGLIRYVSPQMRDQVQKLRDSVGRTAEMGSRTLLHAAVAGKESHGSFLGSCGIKDHQIPDWVTNEEGQKNGKIVWGAIAHELETVEPGCVQKIL